MTTTEPTATADEPEWMRVRRELGGKYLGHVTDRTATDIDYLVARLEQILDEAKRIDTERYLPRDIEELLTELRPHGRAGDAVLADLRARFPRLHWGRYGGTIIGNPWESDRASADECATDLGLPSSEAHNGRPTWQGLVSDLSVRVLGGDQ